MPDAAQILPARTLRLRAALDDAAMAVRCPSRAQKGTLSIGALMDQAAGSYGLVIALVALTAVPFVGVSGLFGLIITLLGLQVVVGRTVPWLPERVRRVELSARTIEFIIRWVARMTSWLAHLVRPRLSACVRGPGRALVGVGLVLLGIGLAIPIPIPGSNLPFIFAILLYALGLMEDDGVLVMTAHIATTAFVLAAQQIAGAVGGAL